MSIIEEAERRTQSGNPLARLWSVISFVSGLLGLASIADDLVRWKGFFLQVINAYRALIHPFFEFLFSWVWFPIPTFVFDYLFIGILLTASYIRSEAEVGKIAREQWDLSWSGVFSWKLVLVIIVQIFLWPLVLVVNLLTVIRGFDEQAQLRRWTDISGTEPDEDAKEFNRRMVLYAYGRYAQLRKMVLWFAALLSALFVLAVFYASWPS